MVRKNKNNVKLRYHDRLSSKIKRCGGERTVIEHLVGRIDNVLSAKELILFSVTPLPFSALVFDNCPVTYPTVLLDYDVSQVQALDSAVNFYK